MSNMDKLKEYQQMGVNADLLEADPHRVIQLLMEGALSRISLAKSHITEKNFAEKGNCIGKAIDIINCLKSSLDHERGGDISTNLDRLYDYMMRRLYDASKKNNHEMLNEVSKLLANIKSAWDEIPQEVREQHAQLQRL